MWTLFFLLPFDKWDKRGNLRGEIVNINYKIIDGKVAIEINLETSSAIAQSHYIVSLTF